MSTMLDAIDCVSDWADFARCMSDLGFGMNNQTLAHLTMPLAAGYESNDCISLDVFLTLVV